MRSLSSLLLILLVAAAISSSSVGQTTKGGNATLYVAPSGESVLIDTGNPGGNTGRDPGRILNAIKTYKARS